MGCDTGSMILPFVDEASRCHLSCRLRHPFGPGPRYTDLTFLLQHNQFLGSALREHTTSSYFSDIMVRLCGRCANV